MIHAAGVVALAGRYGHDWIAILQQYFQRFGIVYLISLPLFSSIIVATCRIARPGNRQLGMLRALSPPGRSHFIAGLGMLMSFVVMMGSFTAFKTMMPDMRGGFLYDSMQADIDRLLHLGYDPGPLLAGLPSNLVMRTLIGWNYSILWSVLAFIPLYFIATARVGAQIRLRYFISLFAVWIIVGNGLAYLFLSAGPAFYGEVTGDHARFAQVLTFVREGSWTFGTPADFQAYLWNNHQSGQSALGSGISAFPSVHIAVSMMNALFLREFSRAAGTAGFAYVGIILVSSVWLGWHYAIDGYISILVVLLLHACIRRVFNSTNGTRNVV
jgi:hypothetical protein